MQSYNWRAIKALAVLCGGMVSHGYSKILKILRDTRERTSLDCKYDVDIVCWYLAFVNFLYFMGNEHQLA